MVSALSLPRLVFGAGSLGQLAGELASLGTSRPLLISDHGLERAGIATAVQNAVPAIAATFLDVPENPVAAASDAALYLYKQAGCDGVIGLGGGSVLDTAKIVAALAGSGIDATADLIGKPGLIRAVAPLIAVPTTVGTGSDSSPVAGLHLEPSGPVIGTRHHVLVPRLALCDPDLVRTLPRRLIAATAIDALSHCIEGYFAEPASPISDALALDGIARVFANVHAALEPDGDAARAALMAAAFEGGAAIHKGLGPAHAIATVCADQNHHHGTLIGVALSRTIRLVAQHVPDKAARIASAMGVTAGSDLGDTLRGLIASLGLPDTLGAMGYDIVAVEPLVASMVASHFNRTSPYAPTAEEYRAMLLDMA